MAIGLSHNTIRKLIIKNMNWFQKYKNRKPSAIISDILLVVLVIIMLVPNWRREVGSVFVRLIMTSPDVETHEPIKLTNEDLMLTYSDKLGNIYQLENMLDKPIFLTYWATWCHHCVAELPALNKLYQEAGKDIRIIILVNEELDVAEDYIASKGFNLPIYRQRSNVSEYLYSKKIPASFLINTKKELILKETGATKWGSDDFIEYLKKL